jgi:hypothetical protein
MPHSLTSRHVPLSHYPWIAMPPQYLRIDTHVEQ